MCAHLTGRLRLHLEWRPTDHVEAHLEGADMLCTAIARPCAIHIDGETLEGDAVRLQDRCAPFGDCCTNW
jgi:hypothetical protein